MLQGVALGLSYVSHVLFARWLGPHEYGTYAFILAAVMLLSLLSRLGLPTVVLRFFSTYRAGKRDSDLRGLLQLATAIPLVLGGTIAAAGIMTILVTAQPVADAGRNVAGIGGMVARDRTALVIGLGAVPLLGLLYVQQGMAQSLQRMFVAFAPLQGLRQALLLVLAGVVWTATRSLAAHDLAALLAAVLLGLLAWQRRALARALGSLKSVTPRMTEWRRWFGMAIALVGVEGAITLIGNADVLMLGVWAPTREVGIYSAAARTALLASILLTGASAVAAPMLSDAFASRDAKAVAEAVDSVLRWSVLPSAAVCLLLIVEGRRILGFFGSEFAAGYVPLVILATAQTVNAATGPVSYLLNLSGRERRAAYVYGACAGVDILLNALLVPSYGPLGAAVATGVAIVGCNVCMAFVVWHDLGVDSTIIGPAMRWGGEVLHRRWPRRGHRSGGGRGVGS